ncbi:MAG: ATP-binding cassette domain-containing protein, partial [Candidatus Methanomethylophilaceae archaeon]|nr:ATP-binding cassette domain-containing protein [Candidatus Methanomethylophilaceae archaeon]
MSFLEIAGLTKTYPHADAPTLEDMNFSVEEGEIVVILGPSGCGKSTFLKLISGLENQE